MKKLIFLIILGLLSVYFLNKAYAQDTQEQVCPKGSYSIGENKNGDLICKLEPTGCPYGDSIPLGPDCYKHAPKPKSTPKPVSVPIQPIIGK